MDSKLPQIIIFGSSLQQILKQISDPQYDLGSLGMNTMIKGIFSDSNNIILWYGVEDMNKNSIFSKFQFITFLGYA